LLCERYRSLVLLLNAFPLLYILHFLLILWNKISRLSIKLRSGEPYLILWRTLKCHFL
jgi:hypothetical protein